jgi:MoxR-like ATPase
LLDVIDRKSFTVSETRESYPKQEIEPLIIITSNQERSLPEPFLRRCLYYHLDFPQDEIQLRRIVTARFGETTVALAEDLLRRVSIHFLELRTLMGSGRKLPGTSELLDFLVALGIDGLAENAGNSQKVLGDAIAAFEDLASKDYQSLLGVLLKTKEDQDFYWERYQKKKSDDAQAGDTQ